MGESVVPGIHDCNSARRKHWNCVFHNLKPMEETMLMLGIERKTNCSLARHEVKCSLGRVIRGIFAGQFSSFVCHGCAGLP